MHHRKYREVLLLRKAAWKITLYCIVVVITVNLQIRNKIYVSVSRNKCVYVALQSTYKLRTRGGLTDVHPDDIS